MHSIAMLAKIYIETGVKIISPCDASLCHSTTGDYKLTIVLIGYEATVYTYHNPLHAM